MTNPSNPTDTINSHESRGDRKHREYLERLDNKKEWKGAKLMAYKMGCGLAFFGPLGAHAGLGFFQIPQVQQTVAAVPIGTAAQVAGTNVLQGWSGAFLSKFSTFARWKVKKAKKNKKNTVMSVNEAVTGRDAVDSTFDKLERATGMPNRTLYLAQDRVWTKRQQVALAASIVPRALMYSVPVFCLFHFGGHYLIDHAASGTAHPEWPLAGTGHAASTHAAHAANVAHAAVNHPWTSKVLDTIVKDDTKLLGLPDKVAGFVGGLGVAAPIHLLATYRRRKVACKIIQGKRVFGIGPRYNIRVLNCLWESPIKHATYLEEREWQRDCADAGRTVRYSAKALTKQDRNEAKRVAFTPEVKQIAD